MRMESKQNNSTRIKTKDSLLRSVLIKSKKTMATYGQIVYFYNLLLSHINVYINEQLVDENEQPVDPSQLARMEQLFNGLSVVIEWVPNTGLSIPKEELFLFKQIGYYSDRLNRACDRLRSNDQHERAIAANIRLFFDSLPNDFWYFLPTPTTGTGIGTCIGTGIGTGSPVG